MTDYYAHSREQASSERWEPLSDHLERVATLAGLLAARFDAQDLGRAGGYLHDLGKATQKFQARLRGSPARVDHAAAGAVVAIKYYEEQYGHKGKLLGKLLAFGIAGHHAGLADGTDLVKRLESCPVGDWSDWQQRVPLALPVIRDPKMKKCPKDAGFQWAFFVRMLFSCLVDADRQATSAIYHEWEHGVAPQAAQPVDWPAIRCGVEQHLASMASGVGPVNALRRRILAHVRGQAELPPGLFSLDVPTGGGKTLTSLAFALDHLIRHDLERIIYVLPYTSIIDQVAGQFRAILPEGTVLEHHSALDMPDDEESSRRLRAAQENWDMPIIVTTSVQFFESLFSNRPSACRKLNRITKSVIILDEAQVLPRHVLVPCVSAIGELARNYGCSIVLCTATQPALSSPDFPRPLTHVRELAPDPNELHESLKRVHLVNLGEIEDAALIQRLSAHDQVLCIVNTRAHARFLYESLPRGDGRYHLTTLMCAAHRRSKLLEIRERLKQGRPCVVVATSLVEAGVDVDFHAVYRAESGLDALIQAAGRCNREGLRAAKDSPVYVFSSAQRKIPAGIRKSVDALRQTLRLSQDPWGRESIEAYFRDIYWRNGEDLDEKNIMQLFQERVSALDFPFKTVAEAFRMIETPLMPLFVPWDESARQRLADLPNLQGDRLKQALRGLQSYVVQIPPKAMGILKDARVVEAVDPWRFEERFLQLINKDLYKEETGLNYEDPAFMSAESLVL
ncbi:MAG: CRISPR-associated helicase Cas3' [Magnetococcus sp. WYHC-3]